MNVSEIFAISLFAVMTLLTFALFAYDKASAKKGGRRIPERALLLCSFLLGGAGGLLGMLVCRHKTKHWYFCLLVPIFAALSVVVVVVAVVMT